LRAFFFTRYIEEIEMKRNGILIVTFSILVSAGTAIAADGKQDGNMSRSGMGMNMAKMDANADGVISKQEFMSAHENMFERMKNKDGVISAKDMKGCCSGMMGMMGGGMMKDGAMGSDSMMENCPMMQGQMGQRSN
jgi:hypothetical protein